jgi:hypothetical protein
MSQSQINEIYDKVKQNENNYTINDYHIFLDFIINKFHESSEMFNKFDEKDSLLFIKLSELKSYIDNEIIFKKILHA